MTDLRKDAIINVMKLFFKEHDVFPTNGIDHLMVKINGSEYKIVLRRGRQTSWTWSQCLKEY